MTIRKLSCLLLALLHLGVSHAAAVGEVIPPPEDVPFPGVITLHVDASDVARRVMHVEQSIPVAQPGRITLLYPLWLPGNHSTTGPVEMLAGLVVRTNAGQRLDWQRDAQNMHAFHVDVPAGVTQLNLTFNFVTPSNRSQGRVVMTPDLLNLQWEKALLYPAGHYARQVQVEPRVTLPPGWQFAAALRGAERQGDVVRFARVPLEMLVDSPLFAGPHMRRIELGADPTGPVRLNVFADAPAELAAGDEQIEFHRRMLRETLQLFGSRHYREYDFLLAISDHVSRIGLEHHESSENVVDLGYFIDWDGQGAVRDLLPHELVHSWNGKFRRPADLWTPSYEVPMGTSLLWVYEGLTEYWGMVIAGRSGLWSPEFSRDMLARQAATFDLGRAGRQWRNLQDTTQQPIIQYRGQQTYPSWQRSSDYYTEGALVWLDVDTKLRELSNGRRSLDDFARVFFGVEDGRLTPLTYVFEDVVNALNAVVPYDWSGMLQARLDRHGPTAPLDGLARGGWQLVYDVERSPAERQEDTASGTQGFLYSVGLRLTGEGKIGEVYWDSPAFKAGLVPESTVVAVNGKAYSHDRLRDAIRAAATGAKPPIELLVRDADTFRSVQIAYHDGLRYPRLERVAGTPDRLSDILRPRTPVPAPKSTAVTSGRPDGR
jgi:predicted metalloprotease with PDZ domain